MVRTELVESEFPYRIDRGPASLLVYVTRKQFSGPNQILLQVRPGREVVDCEPCREQAGKGDQQASKPFANALDTFSPELRKTIPSQTPSRILRCNTCRRQVNFERVCETVFAITFLSSFQPISFVCWLIILYPNEQTV